MKTFSPPRGLVFYAIAILGTFFLMAWLVSFVRKYTLPPPLNAARAAERSKALADLEAENANMLNNYGWVDQSKGWVRLPMNVAMQLTIEEWRQPAAAKAKLVNLANQFAVPAANTSVPGPQPPASTQITQPKSAPVTNQPPATPAAK